MYRPDQFYEFIDRGTGRAFQPPKSVSCRRRSRANGSAPHALDAQARSRARADVARLDAGGIIPVLKHMPGPRRLVLHHLLRRGDDQLLLAAPGQGEPGRRDHGQSLRRPDPPGRASRRRSTSKSSAWWRSTPRARSGATPTASPFKTSLPTQFGSYLGMSLRGDLGTLDPAAPQAGERDHQERAAVDVGAAAADHRRRLADWQHPRRVGGLQARRLRSSLLSARVADERDPGVLLRHVAGVLCSASGSSGSRRSAATTTGSRPSCPFSSWRARAYYYVLPFLSVFLLVVGRPSHRHALDVHLRAWHRLREVRQAARRQREQDPLLHVPKRHAAAADGPRACRSAPWWAAR